MTFLSIVLGLALVALAGFLGVGALKTRALAKNAEEMVPQAGEIRAVPGGPLHYVEMGDPERPTLVMIHGLSAQMQHFSYAMTDLLINDFRIILVDRPGCGYSRRDSAEQAELMTQGRMIWSLLDQLDVSDPVLVGHSLGGAVSLAMALERPEQTRALTLLAPLTHPNPAPSSAFAGLNIPNTVLRKLLARTWAIPMARSKAVETLDEVFRPDPWPEDFVTRAGAGLGLRPKSFLTAIEDFFAADRISTLSNRYATDLKTPGGVLFGAGDALLDPELHGQSMERFGLQVAQLPDRGHMIPITAPHDCAEFVRNMAARGR